MHAEPAAMQTIVEALEPLTQPQRQAVAKKILIASDPEIAALEKILAALTDVKGTQARIRVIRWAMSAYSAPKTARAKKAPKAPEAPAKAPERDRTIDLRVAGA